eukprot:scpid107061/ scgid32524/ Ubiquitin-conjugating enzyme E2 D4; HBUCE1; Ubiquitin carrier protein D4; Ubiquitin-protein ligase D4
MSRVKAVMRLRQEQLWMEKNPSFGCSAAPIGNDLFGVFHWIAIICGPQGSLYEGGVFRLSLDFPDEYPWKPPRVAFITKIYHPIVVRNGEVCAACLSPARMLHARQWSPAITILKILKAIHSLLEHPFLCDPHFNETRDDFKYQPRVFKSRAREWTRKYDKGQT